MPYCAPTIGRLVDPEFVIRVRPFDRHAQPFGEHAGQPAMIDMAMGDEQFLDGHAMLLRHRHQPVDIATRIGKGAAHGFRAPQQGAILLERGDGHDDGLERRGREAFMRHIWRLAREEATAAARETPLRKAAKQRKLPVLPVGDPA